MNQQLKALISGSLAKPFIKIFHASKAHMWNNLQGVFPTMIGFVIFGHFFVLSSNKVAKDDKTNHGWENTL